MLIVGRSRWRKSVRCHQWQHQHDCIHARMPTNHTTNEILGCKTVKQMQAHMQRFEPLCALPTISIIADTHRAHIVSIFLCMPCTLSFEYMEMGGQFCTLLFSLLTHSDVAQGVWKTRICYQRTIIDEACKANLVMWLL